MKKTSRFLLGLTLMAALGGCGSTRGSHCGDCHAGTKGRADTREGFDTVFVCPMHSQVRSNGPGTCGICGMDLLKP